MTQLDLYTDVMVKMFDNGMTYTDMPASENAPP